MSQPLIITARFERILRTFENPTGSAIVAECWDPADECRVECIGKADAIHGDLIEGITYQWQGTWGSYYNQHQKKSIPQLKFTSATPQAPADKEGVIAYLARYGEGLGLGRSRCRKLWELFEADAVRMVREEPLTARDGLISAGLSISAEKIQHVAALLKTNQALESACIDMTGLLNGRGFPRKAIKEAVELRGVNAARDTRRNPFWMLRVIRGASFTRCDKLYEDLGLPKWKLKRQALCAWYGIAQAGNGSTWHPRYIAENEIKKSVLLDNLQADKAIKLAIRAGLLCEIKTDGPDGPISASGSHSWLALAEQAKSEFRLAELVAEAMAENLQWPDVSAVANIDGEQPAVLASCLRGSIAILGGGPGCGKTFVAANLIKTLIRIYGVDRVGIFAPTNMAANRLSEAMKENGVTIRARTSHSQLGMPVERGERWRHNRRNLFPYKVIVIDEGSMPDTDIMCAIFEARARGALVLIVGDDNQFPPVDHGKPMADMKGAGIPYGELTEIRRNSGGIVEACKAIREGQQWGGGDNLEIIQTDDPNQQVKAVIAKLDQCQDAGFDPVWQSRVICFTNDIRRKINKVLQPILNDQPAVKGSPFRVGDKVICRDTVEYDEVEKKKGVSGYKSTDNTRKISNGEIGRVLEVGEKHFIIEVFAPSRVVRVPRGIWSDKEAERDEDDPHADTVDAASNKALGEEDKKEKTRTGCAFDLAYATTGHSSQGCEFPWVICVASSKDSRMGCREGVHVMISRGKKQVKMIGMKWVWDKFCKRVILKERKTLLKERILLNMAARQLEDI